MSEIAPEPWTIERFFTWQAEQADRYELVAGYPVRMMAGAKNVHDDIVVNLLTLLRNKLRGSKCRPFTGDGSVRTGPKQIRRLDVGVDCGTRNPDALEATLPTLVAEVLSPSTRDFDTFEKLPEYKAHPDIDYIMVIEPNAPEVILWSRELGGDWKRTSFKGLQQTIALPRIEIEISLRKLYEDVVFPRRLRLIRGTVPTDVKRD